MRQLPEEATGNKRKVACSERGCGMQNPDIEWFDIKIMFVKINAYRVENISEYLSVHYVPRSYATVLEVNGRRIRPSASAFVRLRRSVVDGNSGEAIYVSTDRIRTTGILCFEVYAGEETLICGRIERINSVSDYFLTHPSRQPAWNVDCSCALDYPSTWHPTEEKAEGFASLEVYIAGCICEISVVLTHTLQLIPRKKRLRQGFTLDAIPEGNEYEHSVGTAVFDSVFREEENESGLDDRSLATICHDAMERLKELMERLGKWLEFNQRVREGHLSWLIAWIWLWVGFGLGMCMSVGVGVGLLAMRAYRGTIRSMKRHIL